MQVSKDGSIEERKNESTESTRQERWLAGGGLRGTGKKKERQKGEKEVMEEEKNYTQEVNTRKRGKR